MKFKSFSTAASGDPFFGVRRAKPCAARPKRAERDERSFPSPGFALRKRIKKRGNKPKG